MIGRASRLVTTGALTLGIALFAVVLRHADLRSLADLPRQLGPAVLVALVPGAVWHLLRTAAWRRAFPPHVQIATARAFRVRIAAEALSYLTISGLAGDPLKVVLLSGEVAPTVAAGAVAIERVAYIFVTALIMAGASFAIVLGMPLRRPWAYVFAGTAILAVAIAGLLIALLIRHNDASRVPKSRSARLLRELSHAVRELTADRRRLVALVALESTAYLMMMLEVWTVLWAAGTPITLAHAAAVETFTRAVSMVGSIIPANIGALEASNLAAAAAVHAASGGIALALVRRLRGLLWCAAGLLVYPRRGSKPPREDRTLVVLDGGDRPLLLSARLGGWTAAERVLRSATRAEYTRALVWTSPHRQIKWQRVSPANIATVATYDLDEWQRALPVGNAPTTITVVAPAVVPSPSLLESALAIEPDAGAGRLIAEVPAGSDYPRSGVFRVARSAVARPDMLNDLLRPPDDASLPAGRDVAAGRATLSMRVSTADEAAMSERRLRASIFKATDGRLARVNRRVSIPISVALIRSIRLGPNAMSVALTGLGLYAGWLFSRGEYATGIAAALLSWVASMLDGCDGELARLQYKESAFGCWLDTIGDYIYYVALFAGITVGVARSSGSAAFIWIGAALGAGMLLTFGMLIVLRWRITNGRPEELRVRTERHIGGTGRRWMRVAAELESCATRATMPYGIVAFAILDLLPAVVVLASFAAHAYWITLATQAGSLLRQHRPPPRRVAYSVAASSRMKSFPSDRDA
jgi:phosphatidylglycerophosphate synthase